MEDNNCPPLLSIKTEQGKKGGFHRLLLPEEHSLEVPTAGQAVGGNSSGKGWTEQGRAWGSGITQVDQQSHSRNQWEQKC